MNYIVLDLEWNQCPLGKQYENIRLPFEIIEIGAVRLNEKLEVTGEFHKLIKPRVYKDIHFRTKQIIHITMRDLRKGVPFEAAIKEFLEWCGEEYIYCTWGNLDLSELQRNMKFYGVDGGYNHPLKYYDIQKFFSILYEDGKNRSNLKYAVDFLGLVGDIEFHSALNDAIYTARVIQKIDFDKVKANYSIDCFHIPQSREEEVYAVFEKYSKYISRGFETREAMLEDREVLSTKCYQCGRRCRKKIRWFSGNNKTYFSLAICKEHGYIKGKIRVRQNDEEQFFAIKTLKLVDEDGAQVIRDRQIQQRQKRRAKRLHEKKER